MMKVFLDTNIVLDTMLTYREDTVYSSLILGFNRVFNLCISVHSFPDVSYITRKDLTTESRKRRFNYFFDHCTVLPLTSSDLSNALKSSCPDFEDALQISCAEEGLCDIIVTGNKKHFAAYTDIPVYTPKEFLDKLEAASRQ